MTLRFQAIQSDGIAELSYLIGDDSTGSAAVIDPRPDCGVYLDWAREYGLSITHALETHIHADFMSGSRSLQQRLGKLEICVSGVGEPDYGYDCRQLLPGDTLQFGSALITARYTPGHTPEHLAFELADAESPEQPWAVFTGDSLFVGSVGRPDLLGQEETDELTQKLFHTMRDYYRELADGVIVLPCHGAGSACGANISDRPMSTIAYEKRHNAFLQIDDPKKFKEKINQGAPPVPAHYPRLKKINLKPKIVPAQPPCPALTPQAFADRMQKSGTIVVDTRDMLAFGGGHIPGAVNIGDRPELSVWAGDMLDPDASLLLVVEKDSAVSRILDLLCRVGITDVAGYLAGGMKAWVNDGRGIASIPQWDVHHLDAARKKGQQILDVRNPGEYQSGHVPGAKHRPVYEMRDKIDPIQGIEKDQPLVVYCGSGYRASIASSLLKREDYDPINVPGSWSAWQENNLPVE